MLRSYSRIHYNHIHKPTPSLSLSLFFCRNRIALYSGAFRTRRVSSLIPIPVPVPPVATTTSISSSDGNNGVGGVGGTTSVSRVGMHLLHHRPLVTSSGGKLFVLYNSHDNNSNNNNNHNNHHHSTNPFPPVATSYPLHTLIPTIYPDLDLPLPGDDNQRPWAMMELLGVLSSEERARLGVFAPSGKYSWAELLCSYLCGWTD